MNDLPNQDIVVGYGVVKGHFEGGWALPFGRQTFVIDEAREEADRINKLTMGVLLTKPCVGLKRMIGR
jgi:hypothetical protein